MAALFNQHQLAMFFLNVLQLSAWLVLILLIFLPLEHFFAVRSRKFFRKSLLQDLSYYFINGLLPSMLLVVPVAFVGVIGHAIVPHRVQAIVAHWPLWERILVGLVVGEVGFYWGHRWTHQIPFLWRFHAVHHSAEDIYFLISSRAHPLDNVFIRLCGLIPAVILGVASPLTPDGTLVPVLIVLVATLWGFFIHANMRIRFGFFEWIWATPGFHHWHHTRHDHKDRNFASMMPIMDWLFGTLYLPADWPAAYGTDTPVAKNLTAQLLDPLTPGLRISPSPAATAADTPATDLAA